MKKDLPSKPLIDFTKHKDHRISDGEVLNSMGETAKAAPNPEPTKPVNIVEVGSFIINAAVRDEGDAKILVSEIFDWTDPDNKRVAGVKSEPLSNVPAMRAAQVKTFFQRLGNIMELGADKYMPEIEEHGNKEAAE